MFERLTDRARRALVLAQEETRERNHNFIGTELVLLGLIHEARGWPPRPDRLNVRTATGPSEMWGDELLVVFDQTARERGVMLYQSDPMDGGWRLHFRPIVESTRGGSEPTIDHPGSADEEETDGRA